MLPNNHDRIQHTVYFLSTLDMEVDGAVEVVAAACVIHNICEMRKEAYL